MHAEFGCGPTVSLICQTCLVLPLLNFENPNPDTLLDQENTWTALRATAPGALEFCLVDFSGHDARTALY